MRNPTKVPLSEFSIFPFTLARVSIKVWIFLGALALTHLFVGYRLSGRTGLWVGFLMAAVFVLLVSSFSEAPLIQKFKARKLQGQDPWNLREIAERFSRIAGVPTPDIFLMDSPTPIAFTMGPSWHFANLCLSTSLLQKLSPTEVEAVVAHQVCHLRRLETFSFAISSSMANSLLGLATVLDMSWPVNWRMRKLQQRPFLTLLAPLAGLILRIAHSDRSYFENDDLTVSLLPDRKALASALWKIEGYCQSQPLDIPPCTNHLFIVNPEGLKESNWFFVTHPKMESRLKRLVGTYPL
jgi:heat shock protein HtpX